MIMYQQDGPIGNMPIVFSPEIRGALSALLHCPYDQITPRMVHPILDEQINSLNITPLSKAKLRSIRDYTVLLRSDSDHLDRIRGQMTCPICIQVSHTPIISSCCGSVFDKVCIDNVLDSQTPDAGGHRYIIKCPLCRKLTAIKEWQSPTCIVGVTEILYS